MLGPQSGGGYARFESYPRVYSREMTSQRSMGCYSHLMKFCLGLLGKFSQSLRAIRETRFSLSISLGFHFIGLVFANQG
jgi:hypothetical protein